MSTIARDVARGQEPEGFNPLRASLKNVEVDDSETSKLCRPRGNNRQRLKKCSATARLQPEQPASNPPSSRYPVSERVRMKGCAKTGNRLRDRAARRPRRNDPHQLTTSSNNQSDQSNNEAKTSTSPRAPPAGEPRQPGRRDADSRPRQYTRHGPARRASARRRAESPDHDSKTCARRNPGRQALRRSPSACRTRAREPRRMCRSTTKFRLARSCSARRRVLRFSVRKCMGRGALSRWRRAHR